MRLLYPIISLALVFGGAIGCADERLVSPTNAAHPSRTEKNVVRLNGSTLFKNDLGLLEPHLEMTTGCITIDQPADATSVACAIHAWHKGKQVDKLVDLQIEITDFCEVSVSVKPHFGISGREQYLVVTSIHHKSSYSSMQAVGDVPMFENKPQPRLLLAHSVARQMLMPIDVQESQSVVVWGLFSGRGSGEVIANESLESEAKRVEWALLMTIKHVYKQKPKN